MLQNRLAEQAVEKQSSGRLHQHLLAQVFTAEIMVPLKVQFRQFVALASLNVKDHITPFGLWVLLLRVSDLHVKIAFALEIIADIARAFVQKIIVDGALLKTRDKLFYLSMTQLGPLDFNVDFRPTI